MAPQKLSREEWLTEAARIMWPWVVTEAKNLERTIKTQFGSMRFSISLMSGGFTDRKSIGHVQYKESTKNEKHEIRISPSMGYAKKSPTISDSIRVCDIVLHEMIHVACPLEGHRGMFPKLMRALGLEGKPTATYATKGTPLYKRIRSEVISEIGNFPHKRVDLGLKRGKRGIGSRMLKITCTHCEIILRASALWAPLVHEEPCPNCYGNDRCDGGQLEVEGY